MLRSYRGDNYCDAGGTAGGASAHLRTSQTGRDYTESRMTSTNSDSSVSESLSANLAV